MTFISYNDIIFIENEGGHNMTDLDKLRIIVLRMPASPPVRRARLHLFDIYRYAEDYDKLYQLIIDIGGTIE